MVTESMRRVFLGLSFIALLSLFGSLVYYTTSVNAGTLAGAVLFAILATLAMNHLIPLAASPLLPSIPSIPTLPREIPLFLLGLASLATFAFLAATQPITTATRSLWLLFSPAHIALLALAFLCVLILFKTSPRLSALLGGLLAFTTSALAAMLFPLGFGFDPFLHRATLEHIATLGTITPKPLYYIGAYSLELVGNILLHIPLFSLDVFLAPLGFAVLIWIALRTNVFHPALLALLPFAAFISTTPQAIGFLWVLALVIAIKNNVPKPYLWLFAIAALAAHPLAGVPAVILALLTSLRNIRHYPSLSVIICFTGILAIPLMFFAQQVITGMNVGFSWAAFTDFSRIPSLGFFSLHGNALMDTAMLFGGNVFFITVTLAIMGLFAREHMKRFEMVPYVLAAIIAFGNFVMLSLGFDFPFLITYERTDFALRLVTVSWIFLLPLASDGISWIVLQKQETPQRGVSPAKIYGAILVTMLFCAHVYVSYPRHDGYTRSAAFNVTAADTEIVNAIAKDAGDTPYVVLGNQTLASAAVQELGFFQYYHGDIFAYPIPTSSPLYSLFLEMIEETPNLETVQEAKNLTRATQVYFVVHDYWWEADERIDEAKKITDTWFTSNDETVTVFVFE